jgi:hypothetical protein
MFYCIIYSIINRNISNIVIMPHVIGKKAKLMLKWGFKLRLLALNSYSHLLS